MRDKMKKLLVYIGALVVLSAISFAAWAIYTNSSFTGYVTSTEGSPLQLQTDFDDLNLDTTNSSVNLNTTMTVKNTNGNLNLNVTIDIEKEDADDSCTNYLDDCDVVVDYEGTEIEDGDNILMTNGVHDIVATLNCNRLSCPQNITTTLTLE